MFNQVLQPAAYLPPSLSSSTMNLTRKKIRNYYFRLILELENQQQSNQNVDKFNGTYIKHESNFYWSESKNLGRNGGCPKLGLVKSSKDKLYAEVAMHGFVFFPKVRSSIMLDSRYTPTLQKQTLFNSFNQVDLELCHILSFFRPKNIYNLSL